MYANSGSAVETQTGRRFDDIPNNEKPALGFAIGGFSAGAFLSELWEVVIPFHQLPNSARCLRQQGDFGGNWFALHEPIYRYFKGFDPNLLNELTAYFSRIRGSNFSPQEQTDIGNMLRRYEYVVPFVAMPLEEGIRHVRFLVEMVINHHRFAIGAPVVGGKAHVGLVTYKGEKFKIIE
jgi:hypothetical protein